MEKSRYVRVIEGEEVRRDDPIKYFLSRGSEVPFDFQRVCWQLKSPRVKIFLEGEKESVLPSVREKQIGGA